MISIVKKCAALLLLLLPSLALAQLEKELLLKMNETYFEAKSFSMNATVNVYEKRLGPNPSASYSGSMYKSGGMYYSELMGKITLVNSSCALIVDEEQKLMVYGKPWKMSNVSSKANIPAMLDSVLFANATLKMKAKDGRRSIIEIRPKNSEYEKIEVTIGTAENTLQEVVYFFPANEDIPYQKITITYTDTKINSKIPSSVFSEGRFITKKSNKIQPAGKWASFRLVDQTDFKYPRYE